MTKKKFQSVLSITTAVIMCISLLFPSVPVWAASEGMGWNTSVSQTKTVEQYDSIDGLSGEILYDTSGKRVMACGGEVRQCTENGVTKWYWFGVDDLEKAEGEEKEEGIHLYSSTDLYNWDYEGIMWDIQGAAHPKILYNAEQKQYVMWVSTFEGVSVGVSNSIKGPFTSVSDTGADHVMGFINLYEERPGTAYALYSNFSAMPGSNNSFFLAQLSSDYKKIEGTPQQIQFAGGTLENMEGGILKKDGKYYIVNAGMSQYAVAASLDSEWEVNTLKMWDGTAYKDIVSKNQTSSVFHVKTDNSDEYVCIGDSVGGETEEVRYIWLPIEFFEDGSAALRELSNWKLDESISGGPENPVLYDSIHGLADEMLYDTEGQKIQACGGEVHQVEESGETKWYWFGEDVPGSSDDASNAVHGIHLYSSSDLYNWTREEDIFKGMSSKEQFETDEYFRTLYGDLSDSEKNMVFECLQNCPTAHPKVLYNEKKRQYVMWVPDFQGAECIAVSDSIKGPFRFVKYCESVTGFVTMYQEKNGAAYVVYQGADGLAIAKLTDDYMDVTDNAQTLTFNGETKLSSAEGAMFKQNGKYYIINAGMKQYAVSDTLAGTWSVHPLQMVSDKGQISGEEDEDYQLNPTSCILPVNTEDGVIYINISDKWDSAAADQTRYVWLPVKFSEDGTIALRELSHWKLEDIQPEEPDVSPIPGMNDSIDGLSGEILYDTAGERVYACGGEVHQVEEDGQTKWYWFGVNDLEMDGQIKQPGIHLYSSTDLYNWVHEGTMGEIGKDCLIAHPKMLYNEQKQQFVMWVELETGGMKVAVSKSIKGPFTLVDGAGNSDITGFINLFKDRDGTAYILYGSRDIYVPGSPETSKLGKVFMAKLSEDYTQVEGASWELQYTDGGTLFNSEGGIFERNGKYYIINAGNPDSDGPQYAVADSLKGPWTVHGIQMWNNEEQKFEDIVSKNQTSNVFQVKTKNEDTYICVGDSVGGEIPEQVRYIWLPVKFFEDGTVALEKLSNWRLELDRPDVEVTEVRLSEESKTLQEGEKYQINATVLPSNASNKTLSYRSSDETVATVSISGEIEAKKAGNATITVMSANGKTASLEVTVKKKEGTGEGEPTEVEVTGVKLSEESKTLQEGEKYQINATVLPSNASNKTLSYRSSDETVATVSISGEIEARKAGNATVIVMSANGKTASLEVTVKKKEGTGEGEPTEVEVTGVKLSEESKTLQEGEKYQINATVLPSNASNKTLSYRSSDETVATVSISGEIEAKKAGNATVTVTSANGKTASLEVTVKKKEGTGEGEPTEVEVTGVKLSEESKTLQEGEKYQINATVLPSNASNKTLSYRSSDETVATVSISGEIEAKKAGNATITVTSANGKTASLEVTVKKKEGTGEGEPTEVEVTGVKLSEESKTLQEGEKYQINATVLPSNASNKTLSYRSSDETVATVSISGEIEARKAGNATVTVTSANGKTASLEVTVKKKEGTGEGEPTEVEVTGVKLSEESKTLQEGEKYQINATVLPSNASNKTLSYRSSDETVATVSAGGEIEAKKAGNTIITVASVNGKTAELQVTVKPAAEREIAVEKVLVSTKKMTVGVGEKVQLEAAVYPRNASNAELTYKASNNKVKVNKKGRITAQKTGTCKITICSSNNKKVVVTVHVKKKPGKISLNVQKKTLKVGKKFQIRHKLPRGTASYNITYSSNKKSVAIVSKTGKVTARKKGKAVITVKTYNGKKAVIKIHVK